MQKDCANCHTRITPEWRRGPSGNRDLCIRCGLRWAKQNGRVSPRTNSQQSESPAHSSPRPAEVLNNNHANHSNNHHNHNHNHPNNNTNNNNNNNFHQTNHSSNRPLPETRLSGETAGERMSKPPDNAAVKQETRPLAEPFNAGDQIS
jgi:hypothetical protein